VKSGRKRRKRGIPFSSKARTVVILPHRHDDCDVEILRKVLSINTLDPSGEAFMAAEDKSNGLLGSDSVLTYSASTMPVVQGALALIVISFIGQVWPNIPPTNHQDAFLLIFASGAHFIFSFFIVAPAALLFSRRGSMASHFGFTVGIFFYTFWSLIVQQRALANLLLTDKWNIPLPFGDGFADLWAVALGSETTALYFSPLLSAYLVAIAVTIVLFPLLRGR
jgi:hypothetical protein